MTQSHVPSARVFALMSYAYHRLTILPASITFPELMCHTKQCELKFLHTVGVQISFPGIRSSGSPTTDSAGRKHSHCHAYS
jgi:hypothetical protein